MTVHVSEGNNPISTEWEKLCYASGHYLASAHNDTINAIYHVRPHTIYVLDEGLNLLGGCKLHVSDSRLLPSFARSISRSCNQLGEYLIKPNLDENTMKDVIQLINTAFTQFIKDKNLTKLKIGGFYGGVERLYKINDLPGLKMVNVGLIDLNQSTETLWDNLHSKHRNVVRKAEADNVEIICDEDIDTLIKMLEETFNRQEGMHAPGADFLQLFYKTVTATSQGFIYKAYFNGQLCGAALIHGFGPLAYYSFSGSNKTHNGANTLMQWRIILDLKARGYKTYSLGNIAYEGETYGNDKFEDGISRFKMRFGCNLIPTYVAEYILSPFKNKMWKSLLSIYGKIKKN